MCRVNVLITENNLISLRTNSQDQQPKKGQKYSSILNVTNVILHRHCRYKCWQKANAHNINQHLGKEANPKMSFLYKIKVFFSLYFPETSV